MTKTTNNENKKIKVYQRKKNVPEKNIIKNLQSQYETVSFKIVFFILFL